MVFCHKHILCWYTTCEKKTILQVLPVRILGALVIPCQYLSFNIHYTATVVSPEQAYVERVLFLLSRSSLHRHLALYLTQVAD